MITIKNFFVSLVERTYHANVKISLLSFSGAELKKKDSTMLYFFMKRLELLFIKLIGKEVFQSSIYNYEDMFFILILSFVFVSIICYPPRAPFLFYTLLPVTLLVLFSSTAECYPGNGGDDASSSVTEALTKPQMEDKIAEFLSQYGKRHPQQRIFERVKDDLKLTSATPADLAEMDRLISTLSKRAFHTPSEAGSRLAILYDSYYLNKYQKHSID
jgi:hypothetical protein